MEEREEKRGGEGRGVGATTVMRALDGTCIHTRCAGVYDVEWCAMIGYVPGL